MTASLVQLRDVHADDLDAFFEHQTDEEAVAMAAFPPRDREAFASHWARVLADPNNRTWTILVAGEVAGYIACFPQHDVLNVGYWLGRPYWGRGVATVALGKLLGEVPERPLFARVAEHNLGSRRVLEKCGFVQNETVPPGPDDDVTELLFRID
jgi:RimJ/RimL family protein N-acetyltransferase